MQEIQQLFWGRKNETHDSLSGENTVTQKSIGAPGTSKCPLLQIRMFLNTYFIFINFCD